MLRIPKITPVRIKTERIRQELISPGSRGSYFPDGVGPRVVYLDESYDYPPQESDDPQVERARQASIWSRFEEDGGVRFLDRQAEPEYPNRNTVWTSVYEELGHHHSAEFYGR